MDSLRFDSFEHFKEDNAGMIVGRTEKLAIYMRNKKTRRTSRLDIDLALHWPADLNPGEAKAKLS